ncbi:MAG: GNAT family N-acetyltransferase [Kurthia sp.]|nr:GNAT family N-acetyltransferase [Candidatus Kurthia equi]
MILDLTVKLVENQQQLEDALFVRREVFVKEQGIPLPLEQDQYDAEAQHIVVYHQEAPIAAGRVRRIAEKVAKVDRVCVLPDFRRKQVGVKMMEVLEKFAVLHHSSHAIDTIKIHAQSHAVPFYEAQNYKITSPEFIDGGTAYRAMEKHFTL